MASSDLTSIAAEAYGMFERRTRLDDPSETFLTLREDAPEWVSVLVREAHGEFLPDDWRYESIHSALGSIYYAESDADLDDLSSEFADGNVDTYNGARAQWLASNLTRAIYCDEAADEGLTGDEPSVMQIIGAGQYVESLEVFRLVRESLEARLAEMEGDLDD